MFSTTDHANVSLEVMRSLALLGALLLVGCGRPTKPNASPPNRSEISAHPAPSSPGTHASSSPSTAASRDASANAETAKGTAQAGTPCGALSCRQFGSPTEALRLVLAQKPLVLGIGEAHAQRGSEGIRSATHRFTHDLLPILAPTSSDLVLELMIPDGTCKKAERQVREVQKGVVKRQASSNQDEFTKLGHEAKALHVRPHVLRPSCDEFKKIKAAGRDGIAQMLTMIANLSEALTRKILARNAQRKLSKAVVLYGGALHNDIPAVQGREKWTFGPALDKATGGRYVALDLIVPEFIKDSDSWRALPWYPYYDLAKLGKVAVLYKTGPRAFTLIFPAST